MSRGLNKVMLIGNLGRDPEMRYTPSGRPVATFILVITRSWNTAEGEKRSDVEKFNIITWGNLAEICNQYLTKGQQVYVEGRLQTRHWENKEGVKYATVEVVASEMVILGEKKDFSISSSEENIIPEDEILY